MEENLRLIRGSVRVAAEEGARLACFHECALTGSPPIETAIESITEARCTASISAVAGLARE